MSCAATPPRRPELVRAREVPPAGNVFPARTTSPTAPSSAATTGPTLGPRPVTAAAAPTPSSTQVPAQRVLLGPLRHPLPVRRRLRPGPAVAYAADGNGRWTDAAAVRPGNMHAVPMGVCNLPSAARPTTRTSPTTVRAPRLAPGSYGDAAPTTPPRATPTGLRIRGTL